MRAICTNLQLAKNIAYKFDAAIQIIDTVHDSKDQFFPNLGLINSLKLRFADEINSNGISIVQAEWIKDFVVNNPGTILVHCIAGVSRSSAVAAAINFISGEENVWENLDAHVKQSHWHKGITPNIRVIELLDSVFECDCNFLESYVEWDLIRKKEK